MADGARLEIRNSNFTGLHSLFQGSVIFAEAAGTLAEIHD
jgi:hypothetical protein